MITDRVLEIHANIRDTLRMQGVAVYFAIVDGSHQCCLSFDNRVLFEATNVDALHYVFKQWCDDESKAAVGRWMAPF